jgi:hypothetical protein
LLAVVILQAISRLTEGIYQAIYVLRVADICDHIEDLAWESENQSQDNIKQT